jgi:hypothetical protein
MVVLMMEGLTMTKEPPFPPVTCGLGKKQQSQKNRTPTNMKKIMHNIGHCYLELL